MATAVLASVDGQITPPSEATVSILDEGLVRGDGAFEVLKLYGNHPFRLDAHLDRLARSAASIELDFDRSTLEAEIAALLERGGAPDGCLRVIITRGGRRLLTLEELSPFPPSVSIALVELTPSEILVGVKSLSYAANMQASRIAAARGADEAVYIRPDGVILEAPTSSIFWVASDGDLRTPSIHAGILDSITRDVLIESDGGLARDLQPQRPARRAGGFSRLDQPRDPADLGGRGDPVARRRRTRRGRSRRGAAESRRCRACRGSRLTVDLTLSDEQRLTSETARRFADEVIAPRIRESDRACRFDIDLARRLGEMGYLGAPVAEQYGGRGLDYVSYALIVEQIGRADSAARTVISVQSSLVCGSIERWGTEEQKQRYLPGLCSGEQFGCFGLTEPDSGSDAASMRSRAERIAGGWRITGQKMWISLGNVADLALVFAQTDPSKAHRGLACFLVPTESPGFSAQEIHGKLGLRSSDTASLALDAVEVPDDAVLGEIGDGFKIAMSALDLGRYSVAAGCVGICDGCVDASVAYATEREQFGVPIARFQLVQAMIAEMIVKRDAARMLVLRAGLLKDAGEPSSTETSIAKLYATESAVECANTAIQVHGGSGYVDDHPVERYLRDARVTTLYEGTSEIQKLIIGRAATGIDAILPFAPDQGGG